MTTVKYKADLDKEEMEWFANFVQFVKFKREGKESESIIFKLSASAQKLKDIIDKLEKDKVAKSKLLKQDIAEEMKNIIRNEMTILLFIISDLKKI